MSSAFGSLEFKPRSLGSCRDCAFYRPDPVMHVAADGAVSYRPAGVGECHYDFPGCENATSEGAVLFARWPRVKETDFCREWTERPRGQGAGFQP